MRKPSRIAKGSKIRLPSCLATVWVGAIEIRDVVPLIGIRSYDEGDYSIWWVDHTQSVESNLEEETLP